MIVVTSFQSTIKYEIPQKRQVDRVPEMIGNIRNLLGSVHKIRLIHKSYYGENWRNWNFFCSTNFFNILHKTAVRASMGVFTFLKFSFLSIFSILTLIN